MSDASVVDRPSVFEARPRSLVVGLGLVGVLLFAYLGFSVGRSSNEATYVKETGDPFTARVDAYQPKSLCITRTGASSGTCAVPLIEDPSTIHIGERVRIQELRLSNGTNAFAVTG